MGELHLPYRPCVRKDGRGGRPDEEARLHLLHVRGDKQLCHHLRRGLHGHPFRSRILLQGDTGEHRGHNRRRGAQGKYKGNPGRHAGPALRPQQADCAARHERQGEGPRRDIEAVHGIPQEPQCGELHIHERTEQPHGIHGGAQGCHEQLLRRP